MQMHPAITNEGYQKYRNGPIDYVINWTSSFDTHMQAGDMKREKYWEFTAKYRFLTGEYLKWLNYVARHSLKATIYTKPQYGTVELLISDDKGSIGMVKNLVSGEEQIRGNRTYDEFFEGREPWW